MKTRLARLRFRTFLQTHEPVEENKKGRETLHLARKHSLDINSLSRHLSFMQRTQIQLPDHLFEASRALARRKEISLAELVRRGLEYLIATSPETAGSSEDWKLPAPHNLQAGDPFEDENWRANIHSTRLRVAESSAAYKAKKKP